MACLSRAFRDQRGVVYVEFLIAFMPVFLLFLAVCQLALLSGAKLVVRHAAYRAARSAIVVLEDSPDEYGGAERGSLSSGSPSALMAPEQVLALLSGGLSALPAPASPAADSSPSLPQQGARMLPIRTSAYLPLVALAPKALDSILQASGPTVSGSFVSPTDNVVHSLAYTRSASAITVHTTRGAEALAPEPIDRNAALSVRVTYLYHCSVPLVRTLMCRPLASLLPDDTAAAEPAAQVLVERMRHAEAPGALGLLTSPGSRFRALAAEVTLPNQGAAYDHASGE